MEDYIVIKGKPIEVVTDEFDHQYLKEYIRGKVIYIPYPFTDEVEESDSLKYYYIKQEENGKQPTYKRRF